MSKLFDQKRFLMIPGPTPVPESALLEMAKHPLPHRSQEFSSVLMDCTTKLKIVACTKDAKPLIQAASGTGAMESVLVNLINPGMRVLSVVGGVFGKRWADMAGMFGAQVQRLHPSPGQAISPQAVEEALMKDPGIELVLLTLSETSTGVAFPVKEIASIVRSRGAILALDAITGMSAIPLLIDDWGIDVVISGSQKGFMIPPGLAFVWVGPRAWGMHAKSKFPRFYWDWTRAGKALKDETTPFTPAVSLVCGLQSTLNLMLEEGVEKLWQRHEGLRESVRLSAKAMGLKLFADDACASSAITSILPPDGLSVKAIRAGLKQNWQIVVADGQAELQGKIFRIGHLGFVSGRDVFMALGGLAQVLGGLGHPTGTDWIDVCNRTLETYNLI